MMTIHASRSRYESFMRCPRLGYLQYHWGGSGIVKGGKTIELITGNMLHYGLEQIGQHVKQHKKAPDEYQLDDFIQKVKLAYYNEVFFPDWQTQGGGFKLSDWGEDDYTGERKQFTEHEMIQQQQYVFDEQTALIEALLRVFCLRKLPEWIERYRIVSVEQDLGFKFIQAENWEVIQSARIDWVLQEIATKDLYLVNFKGYKQFGERESKNASHDTQGLSESWAFDEYLRAKGIAKQVNGIKMLYLIKGARKETFRGSRIREQVSPLIRGYRKLGFDGAEYAHSWFFPNPKNDSGIRALGNSWEKFDLFNGIGLQEFGGIKGWIECLAMNDIQPECGDILAQQIIEPEPFMRLERDVLSWERQTKAREREIADKLYELGGQGYQSDFKEDVLFPQNRQACHYPTDCDYIDVCHGTDEQRANPMENGFVWRVPHHKAELVQIREMK